jgi:ribosomal protein L32
MPNWDQERTARFGQRQTSGALTIKTPNGIECSGCGKPITGHRCLNCSDIVGYELFSYLKNLKALR